MIQAPGKKAKIVSEVDASDPIRTLVSAEIVAHQRLMADELPATDELGREWKKGKGGDGGSAGAARNLNDAEGTAGGLPVNANTLAAIHSTPKLERLYRILASESDPAPAVSAQVKREIQSQLPKTLKGKQRAVAAEWITDVLVGQARARWFADQSTAQLAARYDAG